MKTLAISVLLLVLLTIALIILLRGYVREDNTYASSIQEGERFNYLADGNVKSAICDRNYRDIKVIYTGRSRIEYSQITNPKWVKN